jgi:hypothetical protein
MSMSSASDISNLFQTLGVSPSHYQEVERTEQLQGSRGAWSTSAEPLEPAQESARDDAASQQAEAAPCADAPESAPIEPMPQDEITETVTAAEPAACAAIEASAEVPAAVSTESAEPAGAPPLPESHPESAAAQPVALSSVFARLLEKDAPQADATPRRTS